MRKRYSRSYTVLSFLTMFSYREQPFGLPFHERYLILLQQLLQILLRSRDWCNPEILHKVLQHIGRNKCRQGRAKANVLDAQIQQGQQDAHRLLLIPGKHHGQRQIIHAAAECIGKRNGNLNRTVSIIALPNIHQTGQTANGAKIKVIETVFATGKRQHNRIRRGLFYELRIVIASGTRPIAACNKEEMSDCAGFHSLDDFIRHPKHSTAGKACHHCIAAIDACKHSILGITAQLQCLFDHRSEVLILADVRQFRIGYHRRGEHAVGVACFRRHQAVGGKQHRRRDVGKFSLLILPRRAEVALEMGIFFQFRIAVGANEMRFGVNEPCTRGQIVTYLWRVAGSPTPYGKNPFGDVFVGSYCYDAVLWAYQRGITNGTDSTTFSPNKTVTRGQAMTYLHRFAGSVDASYGVSFTDVSPNVYYAPAIRWATSRGITNGTTPSTFSPDVPCTKAQIVTFLYRFRFR